MSLRRETFDFPKNSNSRCTALYLNEAPCTERSYPTRDGCARKRHSHLIKNYLITFLALISYAWFSLSRAPRLPHHRSYYYLLLLLPRSSPRTHLAPSTLLSCLPFSRLPPSSLAPSRVSTPQRSRLLASEISVLVAVPQSFFPQLLPRDLTPLLPPLSLSLSSTFLLFRTDIESPTGSVLLGVL